jgi:hypothetical protein
MEDLGWRVALDRLLNLLATYPSHGRIFNQYRDVHPELDLADAAKVRRGNLGCYLKRFTGARYILVGEAAGYAGCRFSGIPFTCEMQLVGPEPLPWARGLEVRRSSAKGALWLERSATMVWEVLEERQDCLLWNAFPWHPFGARGPLSNGHPGREQAAGLEALRCLLALFPGASPCAVGRVAHRALAAVGVKAPYIRHPSHGGKNRFVAGVAAVCSAAVNSQ